MSLNHKTPVTVLVLVVTDGLVVLLPLAETFSCSLGSAGVVPSGDDDRGELSHSLGF